MSSLREKFEREMKSRGRSERTIYAYLTIVVALAMYHKKSPNKIGDEEIRDWLLHLIRDKAEGVRL